MVEAVGVLGAYYAVFTQPWKTRFSVFKRQLVTKRTGPHAKEKLLTHPRTAYTISRVDTVRPDTVNEKTVVTKAETPEDLLPLTPAMFHILLALADRERHGYDIMREVDERTEGKMRLGPGTLYGSIKRMLKAGWIEELDERPDPEMDDERRRYYRLTDFGYRLAVAEAERLARLVKTARNKRLLSARGA